MPSAMKHEQSSARAEPANWSGSSDGWRLIASGVVADDVTLMSLIRAIVADDEPTVAMMLADAPTLATTQAMLTGATRQAATDFFLDHIRHYVYAGDTALHLASAASRPAIVRELLAAGSPVQARNRRGAQPLHYAADSAPGTPSWNPAAQRETVTCLLNAGADPNAVDKGGVTPLHRAVRNGCAAAVSALLEGGADPHRPNKRGSTPGQLAVWTTGKSGSGTAQARDQQAEIVRLLQFHSIPE